MLWNTAESSTIIMQADGSQPDVLVFKDTTAASQREQHFYARP